MTPGYILKAFQPTGKDTILYESDPTAECHTEKCVATWNVAFDEGKKAYKLPERKIKDVTYSGTIDNRTQPPTVILTAEKDGTVHTRKPARGEINTLFADNTDNTMRNGLLSFAQSHTLTSGLTRYMIVTHQFKTGFYRLHTATLKGEIHHTRSMLSRTPYGVKLPDKNIMYYVKGETRFGGKPITFEEGKRIRRTN